jgi:capsular polysaccharide biosynthesis protein
VQLRLYAAILRRFWLVVVVLPLAVGALSLGLALAQPPRYGAVARLIISQQPHRLDHVEQFPDVNLNYSWESSEYILDDLPQVVQSMAMAQDISTWLRAQGYEIEPAEIRAGLSAENFHRTVTLSAQATSPELAELFLEGAIDKLKSNGLRYWSRAPADSTGLSIAILDPATGAQPLHGMRWLVTTTALRVALALAVAVALAFLLHYLDATMHNPQQVQEWVGVEVLGVIPRE